MRALFKIMNIGQSIVFVNVGECAHSAGPALMLLSQTRARAIELHRQLEEKGHKVSLIHGQLEMYERDEIVQKFRSQETTVLVSTDLLNRGFDVPEAGFARRVIPSQLRAKRVR
jgi:superfamily II DNA/RNA helicase